ncbi:MAG: hypothetical protein K8R67_03895 [Desulfobacteraceae bacterium]|nr:hypothetical protein [Desulfobacteraceae bacterium]
MTNNPSASKNKYVRIALKHLRDKFPEELNRMEEENEIARYLENIEIKTKAQLLFYAKVLNSKVPTDPLKNYKKTMQIINKIIDEEFNYQKKLNVFIKKHRKTDRRLK